MVGEVVLLLYVWMMNVNQVRCYIFDIECPETWETGTQRLARGLYTLVLYMGALLVPPIFHPRMFTFILMEWTATSA